MEQVPWKTFTVILFSRAMIVHILIVLRMIIHAYTQCNDSLKTVEVVANCPNTTDEWMLSAKSKNCSSESQTCISGEKFKHHCVRDSLLSKLIEVCAPVRRSAGYCIEYDENGLVIQDNYLEPCTNFTPPCSIGYLSTEIYKYQQCYELKPPIEDILNSSPNPSQSDSRFKSEMNYAIALGSGSVVITVVVITFLVVRKRMKKKTGDENPLTPRVEDLTVDQSNVNQCLEKEIHSTSDSVKTTTCQERKTERRPKSENSSPELLSHISTEKTFKEEFDDMKNVKSNADVCLSEEDYECPNSNEIDSHQSRKEFEEMANSTKKDNSQSDKDSFNTSQKSTDTVSSASFLIERDIKSVTSNADVCLSEEDYACSNSVQVDGHQSRKTFKEIADTTTKDNSQPDKDPFNTSQRSTDTVSSA